MKELILWLTIIFGSGYYLATVSKYTYLLVLLPFLTIFLLAVSRMFFKQGRFKISQKSIMALFLLIIPVFVSSAMNASFGFSEIKFITVVIFSYCVCRTLDYETFLKKYVNIMTLVCIMALVGYGLSFTPIKYMLPTVENYNGYVYYSGYLFSGLSYQEEVFYERIQGVFWEPGLLATYVALALFFIKQEHSKSKVTHIFRILIFLITILLTKSGAGILLVAMLALIKFFEKRDVGKSLISVVFVVLGCIPILVFVYGNVSLYIEEYLFEKLLDVNHASMMYRFNSLPMDLLIMLKNPFGVGASNYGNISVNYGTLISSGTSTITTFLAEFGILGIFHSVLWIASLLRLPRNKNFLAYWFTFYFFIFILLKESHETLIIMNCLIIYNSAFFANDEVNLNEIKCNN